MVSLLSREPREFKVALKIASSTKGTCSSRSSHLRVAANGSGCSHCNPSPTATFPCNMWISLVALSAAGNLLPFLLGFIVHECRDTRLKRGEVGRCQTLLRMLTTTRCGRCGRRPRRDSRRRAGENQRIRPWRRDVSRPPRPRRVCRGRGRRVPRRRRRRRRRCARR